MNQAAIAAMRLIEAFVALIVGRPVPIAWDDRASIDGMGVIHLPRPRSGDATEVALLTRLAVHEAGHELHTEKGFADRLDSLELRIFNVLEDPRMEREQCNEYPGAALILSRGMDEMLARLEANLETGQGPAGHALQLDLLIRGYLALTPHAAIQQRAPRMLELLAPGVSDKERAATEAALAALTAAETSLDGEQIAQALVATLRQKDAPEEPPQPELQSQPPSAEPGDEPEPLADPEPPMGEPEGSADGQPNRGADEEGELDAKDQPDGESSPAKEAADQSDGAGENVGAEEAPAAKGGDANTDSAADAPAGAGDAAGGPAAAGDSNAESGGDLQPADGAAGGQDLPGSAPASAASSPSGSDSPADGVPGGDASDALPQGGGDEPGDGDAGPPGAPPTAAEQAAGAGEGDQPAIDLGSLLRETLAQKYGSADDPSEDVGEIEPLSADELERVRVAVSAEHDDLDKLLEATLLAVAAAPADPNAGDGAVAVTGGASMVAAAGADSDVAVAQQGRLQGVQSRLVNVLQRELQDRKRRPRKAAHAGGRIVAQRFWRLAKLGDTRLFAAPREVGGIDAAACLLVDASLSMRERLQQALDVTMAFSLALQRLNVRTKVVRFPASDTAVVETLQGYGESPRACVKRCANLSTPGWTPVGAAASIELQELLQQKRLKNVLAIVTDDEPGDPDLYLAALEHARANDVVVIGVGIGCNISGWIPESVAITDVNELPDALAGLFRGTIAQKLTS